jgi:hypothetical protein
MRERQDSLVKAPGCLQDPLFDSIVSLAIVRQNASLHGSEDSLLLKLVREIFARMVFARAG